MARIVGMIAYMFVLFTCQMLSGEGRQIKLLNEAGTKYVKSPFHRNIRKLSIQAHKSDHSEITPNKIAKQKTPGYLFQYETNKMNFPSLKPTDSSPRSNYKVTSLGVKKVDSIVESNCLGAKCPDNFRPTAPGHSPGAGHSYVTSMKINSPNQLTKDSGIQNSLAESEDDAKHTAPGRSPGAGHAEEDKDLNLTTAKVSKKIPLSATPSSSFSESKLVYANDFHPKSLGNSPDVGHLNTNKFGYCLREHCTDDFRPTKPSASPRASHSHASNSDRKISEQGKHPGIVHPHGGIDDYQPTKPGHSPGAGHAVLDKKEPNS